MCAVCKKYNYLTKRASLITKRNSSENKCNHTERQCSCGNRRDRLRLETFEASAENQPGKQVAYAYELRTPCYESLTYPSNQPLIGDQCFGSAATQAVSLRLCLTPVGISQKCQPRLGHKHTMKRWCHCFQSGHPHCQPGQLKSLCCQYCEDGLASNMEAGKHHKNKANANRNIHRL